MVLAVPSGCGDPAIAKPKTRASAWVIKPNFNSDPDHNLP
jgi:hypothetical protein